MILKKVLYLSFYFEPDLCAGSFRNTPLVKELAHQLKGKAEIDVITTLPNRYNSFEASASEKENHDNYTVYRIEIPKHQSGMMDQVNSFKTYYLKTKKLIKGKKYDLVVASSSRLFTAYLGYVIAHKLRAPLYLDIRDIFKDTMKDVLKNDVLKTGVLSGLNFVESKVFNYASHINLISGGFKEYFVKYKAPHYSFFPNGIDPEFLDLSRSAIHENPIKTITYAGNIGEGQGLHKIIPEAAYQLNGQYKFQIIGDGGKKQKLLDELARLHVTNVAMIPPVSRAELLKYYESTDFLFIHLNDYDAFKKVLPSKIFELGAYDKPIIAGVAGYAYQFIEENISNKILFKPGDVQSMVMQLKSYTYKNELREGFIKKFQRENINKKMATSMLNYL